MAEKMDYNRDNITAIRFQIGGYLSGSTEITYQVNKSHLDKTALG